MEVPMPRTRIAHTVGEWAEITRLITPEMTAEIPFLEQAQLQRFTEEFNRLAGVPEGDDTMTKLVLLRKCDTSSGSDGLCA
jgi:hypothetical protein